MYAGNDKNRSTQAEVTGKGFEDIRSFNNRLTNAGSGHPVPAYPGASERNFDIVKGELLFGFRDSIGPSHVRNRSTVRVWSSLNGIEWNLQTAGRIGILRNMVFHGVSKTDRAVMKAGGVKNGIAYIIGGATTFICNTNTKDIHVGEDLMFDLPPEHTVQNQYKQTPYKGMPPTKLKPIINPVDYAVVHDYLYHCYITSMADDAEGTYGASFDHFDANGGGQHMSNDMVAAQSMKLSALGIALAAIEALASRGYLTINAPAGVKASDGTNMDMGPSNADAGASETAQKEDAIYFKQGMQHAAVGANAKDALGEDANNLLWLAGQVGFVGHSKEQKVQDHVLHQIFSTFHTATHGIDSMKSVANVLAGEGVQRTAQSYVARQALAQSSSTQNIIEGYAFVRSLVIGKSLSSVKAGTENARCDAYFGRY